MIENNDIKHVNLSRVFNAVILYFTIEGRSYLLRWGMALIKEGTFSSKYANYKNVFMKHAICYLQECIYETCNTAVFVCLFTPQSLLLIRDLTKGFEA